MKKRTEFDLALTNAALALMTPNVQGQGDGQASLAGRPTQTQGCASKGSE